MLPLLQPLPLTRRPQPFSDPAYLYEIKYDGFRALAYADPSGVRLISRNGNRFSSFGDLCAGIEFALSLRVRHAVLDGEIACLDEDGCSHFNELLFRRGTPRFCGFDLLHLNGKDLRQLPLIERKHALRRIVPKASPFLMFVDHVESEGEQLFELVCERDLEGIVAKHLLSRYLVEDGNPGWVKVKNRRYSQIIGRDKLFEKRYEQAGAPAIGWGVCTRAAEAS